MKEQKQRKNEEGITLVALVVTIIILLILAGVTLGLVLSDGGLIDKTKEAIGEHEKAQEKEKEELGEEAGMMKNLIDGLGGTGGTPLEEIEVGDYINYTYDDAADYKIEKTYSGYSSDQTIKQDKDMKWRVLNINDDGSIDIISENPTTQNVYLLGTLGYNNLVYYLNDICAKQYSNAKLNVKARSINLKDIEKNLNEVGIEARNEFKTPAAKNPYQVQYGDTKRYYSDSSCRYYPKLAERENKIGVNTTVVNTNGIDPEDAYYTAPTTETGAQAGSTGYIVTQTEYTLNCESSVYFDDEEFYNLIFKTNKIYYLASRSFSCSDTDANCDACCFDSWVVDNTTLCSRSLVSSYRNVGISRSCLLRPIVTIDTNNITIKKNKTLESGAKEFDIVQK